MSVSVGESVGEWVGITHKYLVCEIENLILAQGCASIVLEKEMDANGKERGIRYMCGC